MNKFKLASHNSHTYLPERNWLLKPFSYIIARNQSKDILEQYKAGVRYFDFRLRLDKNDKLMLAHGLATYKLSHDEILSLFELLNKINVLSDTSKIYVRISAELTDKQKDQESKLAEYFKYMDDTYTNLIMIGGYAKYDWSHCVYYFKNNINQPSMTQNFRSRYKADPWPWLFAKLNNKKYLAKGTENEFMEINFV